MKLVSYGANDICLGQYSLNPTLRIHHWQTANTMLDHKFCGARKQLLIYDPHVSDDAMLRLIRQRINAGVDVRVIGKVEAKWKFRGEKFPGRRLHIRAIMRDGRRAFLGSQSLRRLELEKRREIGVIINDKRVVRQMIAVFEQDWEQTGSAKKQARKAEKAERKAGQEPARALAAAS